MELLWLPFVHLSKFNWIAAGNFFMLNNSPVWGNREIGKDFGWFMYSSRETIDYINI